MDVNELAERERARMLREEDEIDEARTEALARRRCITRWGEQRLDLAAGRVSGVLQRLQKAPTDAWPGILADLTDVVRWLKEAQGEIRGVVHE